MAWPGWPDATHPHQRPRQLADAARRIRRFPARPPRRRPGGATQLL